MKVLQKLFRPFIPEKSPEIPKVQSKYLITCDRDILVYGGGNGIRPRHNQKTLSLEQAQAWIAIHDRELQTLNSVENYQSRMYEAFESLFGFLHFNIQAKPYWKDYKSQDFEEVLLVWRDPYKPGALAFELYCSYNNPIPSSKGICD